MLFGSFSDTPNKISSEGETISLKYSYEGDGVGKLEWSLPQQTLGCDPDTMAYNGLIITVGKKPITSEERPENGVRYVSDPSIDPLLHSGDKIGNSLVVYDGYGDIATNSIEIMDMEENGVYYFNAFAADKQLQYHRGGVSSYSLVYGNENDQIYTPSYHTVELGIQPDRTLFDVKDPVHYPDGMRATEETGLGDELYCFAFRVEDDEPQRVEIDGANAKTYGDLIGEINESIINILDYPQSATLPNRGTVWFNGRDTYVFNGKELDKKKTIIRDQDPTLIDIGFTYFDGEKLRYWDGNKFKESPFYQFHTPLSKPENIPNNLILRVDDKFYQWNGGIWCEVNSHFGTKQPNIYGYPTGEWVWIDSDGYIWVYSVECSKWIIKDHELVFEHSPIEMVDGSLWIDEAHEVVYVNDGGKWEEITTEVVFGDIDPSKTYLEGALSIHGNQVDIFENGAWVAVTVPYILYHAPPSEVYKSCAIWMVSTDDDVRGWLWDSLNNKWVESEYVFSQETDPLDGKEIPYGDIWVVDGKYRIWDRIEWVPVDVVEYYKDPLKVDGGDHFYDGEKFYIYNMEWVEADVLFTDEDPRNMPTGAVWFNPDVEELSVWNGLAWQPVDYVEENPTPPRGFEYYDTSLKQLLKWTGEGYVESIPDVYAILNVDGNMTFLTKREGSYSFICVGHCDLSTDNNLFKSLNIRTKFAKAKEGADPVSNIPSYMEEGIGTDGSEDERRELIRQLELQLGHPLSIELTKEQYNLAIRRALETLRRESSSPYERNFMFMDVEPFKQRYLLTNKRLGHNKIVSIMSVHRMRSSFLGQAAGNGIYGQAMLQHMFHMGSFDLISYELISGYVKLLNRMFATEMVYTWKEVPRELYLTQTLRRGERVLLEVMTERTEQDILKDRYLKPWIENYSLAQCMYMLAEIRGKYATLPGAGGGVSLNSSDLRVRADELHEKCMEEVRWFASDILAAGTECLFVRG